MLCCQRFSDLSAETEQPDRAVLYSIAVEQPRQWHGLGLVGEECASYSSLAQVIHCNYMEGQNVNNVSVAHECAHSLSLNLHTLWPWETAQDTFPSAESAGESIKAKD